MTGFENLYYAEMIERFDPGDKNGIGRAILAAACVLAESIDGHAAAVRETVPMLNNISVALAAMRNDG